jgi:hypothetical protein
VSMCMVKTMSLGYKLWSYVVICQKVADIGTVLSVSLNFLYLHLQLMGRLPRLSTIKNSEQSA